MDGRHTSRRRGPLVLVTAEDPPAALWGGWCEQHGVDPARAGEQEVIDFVLDLTLQARPRELVLACLLHAGEHTGAWRTSRYATLLLALG